LILSFIHKCWGCGQTFSRCRMIQWLDVPDACEICERSTCCGHLPPFCRLSLYCHIELCFMLEKWKCLLSFIFGHLCDCEALPQDPLWAKRLQIIASTGLMVQFQLADIDARWRLHARRRFMNSTHNEKSYDCEKPCVTSSAFPWPVMLNVALTPVLMHETGHRYKPTYRLYNTISKSHFWNRSTVPSLHCLSTQKQQWTNSCRCSHQQRSNTEQLLAPGEPIRRLRMATKSSNTGL